MTMDESEDKFSQFKELLKVCCNVIRPKCNPPEVGFKLSLYLSSGPNQGYASGSIFKDVKALHTSDLWHQLLEYNSRD